MLPCRDAGSLYRACCLLGRTVGGCGRFCHRDTPWAGSPQRYRDRAARSYARSHWAVRSALATKLQRSVNILLGSVLSSIRLLSSDARCNTPCRFDIGSVDQDLREWLDASV